MNGGFLFRSFSGQVDAGRSGRRTVNATQIAIVVSWLMHFLRSPAYRVISDLGDWKDIFNS